jgi:hypothetical protein
MMLDKPESFVDLLQQHLGWYPLMEPCDIYKLFYQDVMGSEHLISSPEAFSQCLKEEFEPLLREPSERMLEPVRLGRSLLRLNLRAYKCRRQRVDLLIPPLLETARAFSGDITQLRAAWMGFVQSCEQGRVKYLYLKQVHQFAAWLEEHEFPAVHHSEAYRRAYQPAYRLISDKYIHRIGLTDAG